MIKKDALIHYSDVCITSLAAKSGDLPRATPPPHRRTPKEGAPGSLKEEQKEEEEEEEEDGTQTASRRHPDGNFRTSATKRGGPQSSFSSSHLYT